MSTPRTIDASAALAGVASLGERGAVLLAGGDASEGRRDLSEHLADFGPLPDLGADAIVAMLEQSGLVGRGGGGFPLAVKLDVARRSGADIIMIVNLSESEPASRKDATLGMLRPHLVLDGAAAVARSLAVREVTLHLHHGGGGLLRSLAAALVEREDIFEHDPVWSISEGPARYVAGEASAVASAVEGGPALPRFRTHPLAVRGPSGWPTVVSNAETMAHVAAILRMGPVAWRATGPSPSAGTRLVTLAGGVASPGEVVEIIGDVTIGELLSANGVAAIPTAVLLGGYAGTWLDGATAWGLPINDDALRSVGATLGCGLVAVVPAGRCALAEAAQLAAYLGRESAGQCGPCVLGLPAVAEVLADLVAGNARRRHLRGLLSATHEIEGRGACSHPDAAVTMVRSALGALATDVDRHLHGQVCPDATDARVLHVPDLSGLH